MNGYLRHAGQLVFKCGKCGCDRFKSYPQGIPADRSKGWTYEYVCAKCGQLMGLTIVSEDD